MQLELAANIVLQHVNVQKQPEPYIYSNNSSEGEESVNESCELFKLLHSSYIRDFNVD